MPSNHRRLYRRVHKSQINGEVLTRGAFTPNSNDIDGLSFYDAALITPERLKEAADNPATEYRVVELSEDDIAALRLTVSETALLGIDEDLPGHVVLPALNFDAYKASKRHFRPIQAALIAASRFVD